MFQLLSTFEGRISRKRFWFGFFLVCLVAIILGFSINLVATQSSPFGLILQTLGSMVVLTALSAIVVKRLHDRNKPAMPWAVLLLAPLFISGYMRSAGIGYVATSIGGMDFLIPTASGYFASILAFIAAAWIVIDLGVIKGTEGENTFGQDPLATPKILKKDI